MHSGMKRRLSDLVYRQLLADAQRTADAAAPAGRRAADGAEAGPVGHSGASSIQRGESGCSFVPMVLCAHVVKSQAVRLHEQTPAHGAAAIWISSLPGPG